MKKAILAVVLMSIFHPSFAMNNGSLNNDDKMPTESKRGYTETMLATQEITLARQAAQELINFLAQKETDESQKIATLRELQNIIEGNLTDVRHQIDAARPLLLDYFLSTISSLQLETIVGNMKVNQKLPPDITLMPDNIYNLIGQMAVMNYISLQFQKSKRPD